MNAQTSALKIGLVGLGWPGEQHAEAIVALPSARLAAACDLSVERRSTFASRFHPERLYEDYAAMLADPEIEAVVVALPNFLHHPATLEALRAGKHVLCEKPPTLVVAEMEEIRREAARLGLVYCFGRQSRFHADTLTARKMVADGQLGDVYFARAERVRSRGIPSWGGGWFLDHAKAGGGAMIDIGIHALDTAWFILGCPRPLSVSAQVSTRFRHLLPDGIVSDVEDSAFAFVRFEGGIALHLEVAWAANVTAAVPVSSWAGHESEDTTLYGTRATLRLNPLTVYTMNGSERQEAVPPSPSQPGPFTIQMDDFVQAIANRSLPVNDVDQAVALMKMIAAVYQSSASNEEVRLPAEPK